MRPRRPVAQRPAARRLAARPLALTLTVITAIVIAAARPATGVVQGLAAAAQAPAGAASYDLTTSYDPPARFSDSEAQSRAAIASGRPTRMIVTLRMQTSELSAAVAELMDGQPPPTAAAAALEAAARAPDGGRGVPAAAAAALAEAYGLPQDAGAALLLTARLRARAGAKQRAAAAAGAAVALELEQTPVAVVEIGSLAALRALRTHPSVVSVESDRVLQRQLAESLPLIDQPAAAAKGWKGAGCYVAVLDTGADYTQADLGSCSKPGDPEPCRVAFAKDYAPDDNNPDAGGHGTNVASIVAGVAPKAKILAMDVFRGNGAFTSDIFAAINDVIASKRNGTYEVCSMNLSLGWGVAYAEPCVEQTSWEAVFAEARAEDILAAVASGNDASKSGIGGPACCPSAVSVGAVYDTNLGERKWGGCSDATTAADEVTCFSNAAYYLGMLAPGAVITAGGYTMAGTSMAAPHAAGAMAVLKAAVPNATPDQVVKALQDSGKMVVDRGNTAITRPRINVTAAVLKLRELSPDTSDRTPPNGTVIINGGAGATTSLSVALTITGSDDTGVTSMCISNNMTTADQCGAWERFSTKRSGWQLAAGDDGPRSVFLFLRDASGNTMSPPASATINLVMVTLDADPPVGAVVINNDDPTTGSRTVALTISASDATGVTRMCVSNTATNLELCNSWEAFSPTKEGWQLVAGPSGVRAVYVYLRDVKGNTMATPATDTINYLVGAVPALASTLRVNRGKNFTRYRSMFVSTSAKNASASTTKMCLLASDGSSDDGGTSDPSACSPWITYATSKTWSLPAGIGQGPVNVTVFFKDDSQEGVSWTPASDGVVFDSVPPQMDTAKLQIAARSGPSKGQITLTMRKAAEDGVSGVSGYVFTSMRNRRKAPPAQCVPPPTNSRSSGWASDVSLGASPAAAAGYTIAGASPVAEGNGTAGDDPSVLTKTISGLRSRSWYSIRVCAVDNARNTAEGLVILGVRAK